MIATKPPRLTGDSRDGDRLSLLLSRILIPLLPDGSPDFDACWIWQGSYAPNGYGQVVWKAQGVNQRYTPHKLINEYAQASPVPPGFEVDHKCNRRGCCNPSHHQRVTHRRNIQLMQARRRDWRSARDAQLLQEICRYG